MRFRDTGAGIPPGELKNLFIPFYTTKEKGTGLGLPISQRIIENHGGTIEVREPRGGDLHGGAAIEADAYAAYTQTGSLAPRGETREPRRRQEAAAAVAPPPSPPLPPAPPPAPAAPIRPGPTPLPTMVTPPPMVITPPSDAGAAARAPSGARAPSRRRPPLAHEKGRLPAA